MRKINFFILLLLAGFLYCGVVFASNTAPANTIFANCSISSTLKIGSAGDQVKCLQKTVGVTVDGHFGPLTKASVVSFQIKNQLSPDGVVGPLTRIALSHALALINYYPEGCDSIVGYSPLTGAKCDSYLNSVKTETTAVAVTQNIASNSGDKNPASSPKDGATAPPTSPSAADQFISTVLRVAKDKGVNTQNLELIKETLNNQLANNSLDSTEKFKAELIREASVGLVPKHDDVFSKIFAKTFSFLGITPSVALAADNGIPFGGSLTFATFCPVSANWMIAVTPLPPTYAELLSYTPETQGFASYNIPFTTFLLGHYAPPGVCSYSLVNIPTEGNITPVTGSSPF